jgi:ribosomal protein S18 acetylase RimI-like enzyme
VAGMIAVMETGGYQVRRVRAEDWRQSREIRLEALKDTPIGFGERYEDAYARPEQGWRERAKTSAESAQTALFVAIDETGRFVGTAGVFTKSDEPQDRPAMTIYGVYVTPSHRGASRGVASLLFDAVVRWAREAGGAREIRLSVHEENDRAHAFYRRYGFVDTGERIPYILDESASLIEMRYEG